MGYVERRLEADERVIFRTRLHPVVLVGAASFAAFIELAAGLVIRHNELSSSANLWVAIGGTVLAVVSLLPAWMRWRVSELALTTKRLMVRLGLRRRHAVDLPLAGIEAVVVEQNASGRLLGHATVAVHSVDGTVERVPHVAHAAELREAVLRQLPAVRGKSR
jgi:uncharacterized membrane protein YdbT with pleckstrin-like domain